MTIFAYGTTEKIIGPIFKRARKIGPISNLLWSGKIGPILNRHGGRKPFGTNGTAAVTAAMPISKGKKKKKKILSQQNDREYM